REVLAALERVCQKRSQVRVAVWGEDSALLDQLSIQLAQKFRPTGFDQWGWPRQLAYIDIGLAPVFNLAEERLRRQDVLEYMSMKIPWLASEFPDDRELRPYGWLVQNSASAWERVLLDMVDHLEAYMDEAAGEPYLFGISQALDENLNKVLSIYTSIWKKSRQ
ncbi:MAG: hypothetical protein M1281_03035, partial [Chloroflexi bacterium]|nr:hypothetical protein [Chloroflexota bacterium]